MAITGLTVVPEGAPIAVVACAPLAPAGPIIAGTSVSSVTIGLGPRAFVMEEFGLGFLPGIRVRATYDVNDWMEGIVTAYDEPNLTVLVDLLKGSGTYSTWTITVAGEPGLPGDAGPQGPQGIPGTAAGAVRYDMVQSLTGPQQLQARQNLDGAQTAHTHLGTDVGRQMSITSDASGLKLVNDAAAPGNTYLYGTDGSGVKGWRPETVGGVTDGDKGDVTVSGGGTVWSVDKQMSIISDALGLKLSGDATTPGANKTYGTDGSGVKGWKADPTGGGGVTDGDKGDIVVSGSGTAWVIDINVVDNTKLADMPQGTFKMRASGSGTGDPIDGTPAQAKVALAYTTTDIGGCAALNVEDQVLTGGARVTVKDLGNLSGATITPDPGDRAIQKITNNGAGTIAPGSNVGQYTLTVINAAGAGAITTSGWNRVDGTFDTTTTSKFVCSCIVTADLSYMSVVKVA